MATSPVTLIFVVLLSVTWRTEPKVDPTYTWVRLHTLEDVQWGSLEECEAGRVAETERWAKVARYVARRLGDSTDLGKTRIDEVVGQCVGISSEDSRPLDVPDGEE